MVTTGKKRGNISKEIPKTPAPPSLPAPAAAQLANPDQKRRQT
eukprot:COSAG04_NODE_33288_length_161_cov_231.548387_1_plen_42_part_10